MKKIISITGIMLFVFLIASCSSSKDVGDISVNTTQQVEETKNQHIESQETKILCKRL